MNGKEPEVAVLIEGDEETIADFKKLVETRKPEDAEASNVAFEDYEGDVMRAAGYLTHFRQMQADVKAKKERLGMS